MQINAARREISFKLVYYGPGLSGKTTNVQVIHKKAPPDRKGQLTSIATDGDRTLFFDYMPLELGAVNGFRTKFQIYSVPGQKYYDATRKLVLQGADGVCFVADSQASKMQENVESLENLAFHLKEQGLSIEAIPLVLQWNKRDLPDAVPVEDLELKLNKWGAPSFEAVAVTGEGVFPTLKKLVQLVIARLPQEKNSLRKAGRQEAAPAAPPAKIEAPPPPAPIPPPPRRPEKAEVPPEPFLPSCLPESKSPRRSLLDRVKKLLNVLLHRR